MDHVAARVKSQAAVVAMAATCEHDTADITLRDWLEQNARINPKILHKTLQTLEAQDVLEVDDLRMLVQIGGVERVLPEVTAAKIAGAFGGLVKVGTPSAFGEPVAAIS